MSEAWEVVRRVTARNRVAARKDEGSLHDDAYARRVGYAAALVPGIVVCAQSMPVVLERWGEDWLTDGGIDMRHDRPVFDGDVLDVVARFSDGEALLEVRRDGQVLAAGAAWLGARERSAARIAALGPKQPIPDMPPPALPATLAPGQALGTRAVTLEADTLDTMLADADLANGRDPVSPYVFQKTTTQDAIDSFSYASPGIHVYGETQMLSLARPGDTLTSRGAVTRVWERKGHHYFETEQLVENGAGRPVALCRRWVIYLMRDGARPG